MPEGAPLTGNRHGVLTSERDVLVPAGLPLHQRSPTFLVLGTSFMGNSISTNQGAGAVMLATPFLLGGPVLTGHRLELVCGPGVAHPHFI